MPEAMKATIRPRRFKTIGEAHRQMDHLYKSIYNTTAQFVVLPMPDGTLVILKGRWNRKADVLCRDSKWRLFTAEHYYV